MHTVGRWALRVPDGTDGPPNVPLWMDRLAVDLTDVAKDNQGTLAARPTSTTLSPGVSGRYYFVTGDPNAAQNNRLWRDTGIGWIEIPTGAGQPRDVGEYKYAVDAVSHGARADGLMVWLLCDGSEIAAGYVRLLAKLTGNPFGVGVGGRPKLPALAERVPLMPGAATGLTTRALGAAGGEEAHTMTTSELVPHFHTYNTPTVANMGVAGNAINAGAFQQTNSSSQGAGVPFNVMQPYLVAGSWFMYAGTVG